MSKVALLGLIDSLEAGIQSLRWEPAHTEWADYYTDNNYTAAALEHKKSLVSEYLGHIQPTSVWDLGANVGIFSRLASERGITTVAFDIDPAAVERNYLTSRQRSERHLLPLVQDLVNPSSNLGWHSHERLSLLARAPAGALMALALVHHLAISNNVPLDNLARFFHSLARWLIIEFVPKSDSQVQRLFASREDIFPDYTREGFEQVFSGFFRIQRQAALRESDRWLYLMEAIPFE
jgi:ribosomal protein L11 methylase PrmA